MDNLGPLKAQIMTMFMMKKPNDKANPNDDIFMVVYTMLFMNFIEYLFKHIPKLSEVAKGVALAYFTKKTKELTPLLMAPKNDNKKDEIIYSIKLQRHFYKSDSTKAKLPVTNNNMEKIDAVIDYLCSLNNVKTLTMGSRYSLNTIDEIELTPLLKAKVRESGNLEGDEDGLIEIVIYSTVLKIPEIRDWIERVYANYTFEKNNKLGNGIYYFNEIPTEPPWSPHPVYKNKREYRWDNAQKMLTFRMTEFKTSKSFSNIYGDHVTEMKERLNLFLNHPEWYIERGIPHSLGILLHGVPGGGKTSTIKAISKDTNRHIFNLSLREYTSQQQLTNLFFNDTISVITENNKHSLKIPINKRIYVIEDIDCLTDVVLDRELYPQENTGDGDAITLSFLLNLLDGVLETPGRILVITSNYPERLDKAFIRPGRIDVKIEFTYTNRTYILDMINKFYTITMSIDDIPENIVNIFTPAEIMECMCTYFKEPTKAIELMQRKLIIKEEQKEKEVQLKKRIEQEKKQKQEQYRDDNNSVDNNSVYNSVDNSVSVADNTSMNEQKSNNTDPKSVDSRDETMIKLKEDIKPSSKNLHFDLKTAKEDFMKKHNMNEESYNILKNKTETAAEEFKEIVNEKFPPIDNSIKTFEKPQIALKEPYDSNDGLYCSYESAFEQTNPLNSLLK